MKVDKYSLKAESSLTIFEFVSEGPNGLIRKLIQFQETNQPDVYTLAFGDRNADTGGKARIRLYRMGITRFYKEMIQDFEFYGQNGSDRRSGRIPCI